MLVTLLCSHTVPVFKISVCEIDSASFRCHFNGNSQDVGALQILLKRCAVGRNFKGGKKYVLVFAEIPEDHFS